jgi:restriction system protein
MKLLPEPSESSDNDDVSAALHLLGESLQAEVQRINHEGSQAMQVGDYDTAQAVIDFAKLLTAFRAKVSDLGAEWLKLENLRDKASIEVQQIVSKRFFGKSKKGLITPHLDYCRPLLAVLEEIGGSGKTKQVLDLLGEKMKPILKPLDYAVLPSDGKAIRWRNSAQWARNDMVHEDGRMKKTKNGIWEISDKGRKWLKEQK